MKRMGILVVLFTTMLMWGSSAQPPISLVIGAVLYQADAMVWPTGQYEAQLEADLDLLPLSDQFPEERLPAAETRWQPPIDLIVEEATTVAKQVSAIEEFLETGIDGLMIMPIADDARLRTALQRVLDADIPVMLANRQLPALSSPRLAYVGLEHYQLGYAIGRGALGIAADGHQQFHLKEEDKFLVIASDLAEPTQQKLSDGFGTAVVDHLVGTYEINASESYARTQSLIAQMPGLTSIFIADSSLVHGALQAVQEVATSGDQIRIVSYGAPHGYLQLIEENGLNGIVSQDFYSLFLKSLVQIKTYILHGVPLHDEYISVELRFDFHLPYGTFTRYPYENPFGFDLLWMWWFG